MNLGSSSLGSVELGGVNGQPTIYGTLIITLDDATFSGTGSVAINGTLYITLADVGFVFRGRVAQPPAPPSPADGPCLAMDRAVAIQPFAADESVTISGLAFDSEVSIGTLSMDNEVEIPCER